MGHYLRTAILNLEEWFIKIANKVDRTRTWGILIS